MPCALPVTVNLSGCDAARYRRSSHSTMTPSRTLVHAFFTVVQAVCILALMIFERVTTIGGYFLLHRYIP
jgi:hypothetical protein